MAEAVLSLDEVNEQIESYISLLVDDEDKRERLIRKSKEVAYFNIQRHGLPTSSKLQKGLGELLDNRSNRKKTISIDAVRKGSITNILVHIGYREREYEDEKIKIEKKEKKRKELQRMLQEDYDSLLRIIDCDDVLEFLVEKKIPLIDINSKKVRKRVRELEDYESEEVVEYRLFEEGIIKTNPIVELNDSNIAFVGKIVREIYEKDPTSIKSELEKRRFSKLIINEGGIRKIVEKTTDLLHKVPKIKKWNKEDSVEIALKAIGDVLYRIPNYKEAEKNGNREIQLKILDKIIKKNKVKELKRYGLRGLLRSFGRYYLGKKMGPKDMFEFYSDKKGLDWWNKENVIYLDSDSRGRVKVIYKNAA